MADLMIQIPQDNPQPIREKTITDKPTTDWKKPIANFIMQWVAVSYLSNVAVDFCEQSLERSPNPFIALCLSATEILPTIFILHKLSPTISQDATPTIRQRVQRIAVNTLKYTTIGIGMFSSIPSASALLGVSVSIALFNELEPLNLKRMLFCSTGQLVSVATTLFFSHKIGAPSSYIPAQVFNLIERYVLIYGILSAHIRDFMGVVSDAPSSFRSGIIAPFLEEVYFRGLTQELLMRRLPKMILNKLAPDHEWIIDSTPCKVARIALSSALFAIMHEPAYPPEKAGSVIQQFFAGVLYGYQTELSSNVLVSIQSHMAYNTLLILGSTITKSLMIATSSQS